MGLNQSGALTLLFIDRGATFDITQLNPGLDRELLDDFSETQVVNFLDEGEHITALPAPEAVPHAAARGNVKTGAALVMEWA
ncbi:unannotated protein [freshwater metagenome]|uniref:Unannotated protein n=1 Tax=freshwater metagenome TaxID=449393 RepID=A0A6J7R6V1_9ZZZZ